MPDHAVRILCGEISLAGWLHMPAAAPELGVVVCHPHPLYGGSMDNNVVFAVARELLARGIAVLRFNFRGVGGSEGSYGEGVGERADVDAALTFLAASELAKVRRIGLAGYSFGGGVALKAAVQRPDLAALALISPALDDQAYRERTLAFPKLIVTGQDDPFATPERVRQAATQLPPPLEVETYPSVDHFWWGSEAHMAQRVARFFAEIDLSQKE